MGEALYSRPGCEHVVRDEADVLIARRQARRAPRRVSDHPKGAAACVGRMLVEVDHTGAALRASTILVGHRTCDVNLLTALYLYTCYI